MAKLGARHTDDGVTVTGVYNRLATVWRILSKLHAIARQWVKKLVQMMALRQLNATLCLPLAAAKPAQPTPVGKIEPP
ncbi:MAG: hypothetical protein AAFR71_15005 [Pseudomonadota bacterium]